MRKQCFQKAKTASPGPEENSVRNFTAGKSLSFRFFYLHKNSSLLLNSYLTFSFLPLLLLVFVVLSLSLMSSQEKRRFAEGSAFTIVCHVERDTCKCRVETSAFVFLPLSLSFSSPLAGEVRSQTGMRGTLSLTLLQTIKSVQNSAAEAHLLQDFSANS